jgi:hypothetical protein
VHANIFRIAREALEWTLHVVIGCILVFRPISPPYWGDDQQKEQLSFGTGQRESADLRGLAPIG